MLELRASLFQELLMKNTVSKQRFTPSNVCIFQLSHLVGVTNSLKVKTLLLLLFITITLIVYYF